jgi:hypothetical protein
VFCEYCAKPFTLSRACYDAHDAWFCSEQCEADAVMALAQDMLRARQPDRTNHSRGMSPHTGFALSLFAGYSSAMASEEQ